MPTDGSAISQIYTQSTNDYYGLYKSSDIVTTGNNSALTGVWQHVAFTRSGSTCYAFLDGVLKNTATSTATFGGASGTYRIGSYNGSGGDVDAYMQDLRIYKGVAKYTSDFVVPSTSPDILPDTPSGVSGGSKLAKITDGAVNFDGTGDYLDVANVDTAFGSSSDWTLELFIYPRTVGLTAITDPRTGDSTNHPLIWIKSTGVLYYYAGGADRIVGTTVLATNKWHHVAVVRSGGTTTLYLDGKSEGSFSDSLDYASTTNFRIGQRYTGTAYNYNGFISNLRLVNGTAVYTGPRITPPAAPLTNVTNTKLLCCQSNRLPGEYTVSPAPGGLNDGTIWTSLVNAPGGYYDPSYRAELLFNGDTSGNSDLIPAEGNRWTLTYDFGSVTTLEFFTYYPGGSTSNGANAFEVNGSTVTPSSKTNSGWTSLPIAGGTLTSFGSKNTSVSGQDYCFVSAIRVDGTILLDPIGVYGNAAATNFNPFTTDINTVRGQETGYATLNPLFRSGTYSDGNLVQTTTAGNGHYRANIGITTSSGKFYFEYQPTGSDVPGMVGFAEDSHSTGSNLNGTTAYSYYGTTGNKQGSPSNVDTSYGATFTFGDVIGVAFDSDNGGSLEYFKNGVSQGVAFSNEFPNFPYYPAFSAGSSSNTTTYNVNFGQKPFKFPPPDGFQPLNTANIRPETVIARPDQYVDIVTYASDGNARTISGLNFQPDLVWQKQRTNSDRHFLTDSVRGAGTALRSDSTAIDASCDAVESFTSDGWNIASGSANANQNGEDYVAWTWKAGGNKNTFNVDNVGYATTTAAGLTAGDTTVTGASVGTKQGFSIIKYTGPNDTNNHEVPHGLSQAPDFIIAKKLRYYL